MTSLRDAVQSLVPRGSLRAAINFGNPVLAQRDAWVRPRERRIALGKLVARDHHAAAVVRDGKRRVAKTARHVHAVTGPRAAAQHAVEDAVAQVTRTRAAVLGGLDCQMTSSLGHSSLTWH